MSKAQKAVDPKRINSLKDWADRYQQHSNLEFDPVTRVPTVFNGTTPVKTFELRKGYDIPTVLTNPSKFDPSVVATATAKVVELRGMRVGGEEMDNKELEKAMSALVVAWRAYHASPPSDRGLQRQDVLLAEATLRELEKQKCDKVNRGVDGDPAEKVRIHIEEFRLEDRELAHE